MPDIIPAPYDGHISNRRTDFLAAAWLIALLALAALVYWPGLTGGFLFDDFANLPALGRYGGVHDWQSFTWFLTSGIADPTGRPVAMLSLLIDAQDWPADPWPFKRTNLLLHLANGALLYSVLSALGRRLSLSPAHARYAALLAAAAWLLHPLWVSTVLYVIQRHAMLAAFFVLAGVRAWVAASAAFDRDDTRAGWCLAVLAVPVFGLLAGLSKANGFLLPVLIATLEFTALSNKSRLGHAVDRSATARWLFVWIPAALLVLALAIAGLQAADGTLASRGWTLGQRLLSQPRAIFEYLSQLVVPGLDARGVFADNFVVSQSLLRPASTLFALLGLLALFGLALATRRTRPALAAAILFFLAGHLVESSVIPLELYFEHRNYLPAMLLFWPTALWLTRERKHAGLLRVGAVAALALFALFTHLQARLWSDPFRLGHHWAASQPDSARAQAYAASLDLSVGKLDEAVARLAPLASAHPDEPQYALGLLGARCQLNLVSDEDLRQAAGAIRAKGIRADVVNRFLTGVLSPGAVDPCNGLAPHAVDRLLAAALAEVGADAEFQGRAAYLRGLAALRASQCDLVLAEFDKRLEFQRRPEFALSQVGLLATHCGSDRALQHLDRFLASDAPFSPSSNYALRVRDALMIRDGYWSNEWTRLYDVLREEQQTTRK